MMKGRKRKIVLVIALCAATVAAVVMGERFALPRVIHWREMRAVDRVMRADHVAIRDAGRVLLARHSNEIGKLSPKDGEIPKVIRDLSPNEIELRKESVLIDVGNVFNPFGLSVFADGVEGHGARRLMDGLWVFHDGQLEEWDANHTSNGIRQPADGLPQPSR